MSDRDNTTLPSETSTPKKKTGPQLDRATFSTSRLLDFCSRKELVAQTGHQPEAWPLVIIKELVDNALDACEEAGTAPAVRIRVDDAGITVTDNGPGIPAETIEGVLDFSIRVSSREAYVAPDRGAQGNALKTIVAMPFVVDGSIGAIEVAAHGVRHRITFAVDPIRQEPAITHDRDPDDRKKGTEIRVIWPDSAHARQIMYAARGYIQRTADRPLGKKFDQYFTQTLLPDYIEEMGVDWNVVFDARGHFHEPHTKEVVPLGTIQVHDYLARKGRHHVGELSFDIWEARYPTLGPASRYGAILFIEKEGFMPLFEEVKLAERYDIAIMSTKGMSVTASRELVDDLCGDHDIPLLVLHDFDKSGFSIVGTLQRDTRRYEFEHDIKVIDLGLRMADIDGLETEDVYTKSRAWARWIMRENGATVEEIDFLLEKRVELNALASDALVTLIEDKLEEHGVSKVIPDEDCLVSAYRRAAEQAFVQKQIDEVIDEARELGEGTEIPKGLRDKVKKRLQREPATTWDQVVKEIANRDLLEHDDR